jgi:hypothetical protein
MPLYVDPRSLVFFLEESQEGLIVYKSEQAPNWKWVLALFQLGDRQGVFHFHGDLWVKAADSSGKEILCPQCGEGVCVIFSDPQEV